MVETVPGARCPALCRRPHAGLRLVATLCMLPAPPAGKSPEDLPFLMPQSESVAELQRLMRQLLDAPSSEAAA